jgi:hypothetical protein
VNYEEGDYMRTRDVLIRLYLNEAEALAFDRLVERSGLSRAAYLRHLINGIIP